MWRGAISEPQSSATCAGCPGCSGDGSLATTVHADKNATTASPTKPKATKSRCNRCGCSLLITRSTAEGNQLDAICLPVGRLDRPWHDLGRVLATCSRTSD